MESMLFNKMATAIFWSKFFFVKLEKINLIGSHRYPDLLINVMGKQINQGFEDT